MFRDISQFLFISVVQRTTEIRRYDGPQKRGKFVHRVALHLLTDGKCVVYLKCKIKSVLQTSVVSKKNCLQLRHL